jgi:hypothetical protein
MPKFLIAVLLIASVALLPMPATAAPNTNPLAIPITGTGPGGTFAGTFTLNNFSVQNGQLAANGTLIGTLTNTTTGVVTSIVQTISTTLVTVTGSCPILHLVIGPISLDLLGLQITTNQIVLDITAQSGPGNLLGNLLCSVANLLNSPGPLANLLNQILGILQGL